MNASNSYGYRKHIHELCKLCGQNSRLKSCRKKRRKKDNDTTVEKLWKENEGKKDNNSTVGSSESSQPECGPIRETNNINNTYGWHSREYRKKTEITNC